MFAYKIVMLGDFGVGKTSLVRRFVDNSFSEEYLSTIGVAISKKLLKTEDDIQATMMIWDIEGKAEYKPIFKQYLMGAKAFIIVTDLTRQKTENSIDDYLKLCQEIVKDAPVCIALNKSDLESQTLKSLQEIKELSENIITVHKTSAKDNYEVSEIFSIINKTVISKMQ